MPGISIHVVDVSRGMICDGMEVVLHALDAAGKETLIVRGKIARSGLLEDRKLADTYQEGRYRAVFHIGAYYAGQQVELPLVPFLDVVTYDFGIDDPQQHYHLPMKCTPWGYSCFRGGA